MTRDPSQRHHVDLARKGGSVPRLGCRESVSPGISSARVAFRNRASRLALVSVNPAGSSWRSNRIQASIVAPRAVGQSGVASYAALWPRGDPCPRCPPTATRTSLARIPVRNAIRNAERKPVAVRFGRHPCDSRATGRLRRTSDGNTRRLRGGLSPGRPKPFNGESPHHFHSLRAIVNTCDIRRRSLSTLAE